ncbi:hypothetical protein IQ255_09715 [Pleurocapsales cyanobacterium LEGE 10410]|nr:hypothetical protein [Pleurocapsales cyanobacterium LEGE 10410]
MMKDKISYLSSILRSLCALEKKFILCSFVPLQSEIIDGGYIHSCSPENKTKKWFEVIVGKSITDAGDTKCFGGVTSYDQKPKRMALFSKRAFLHRINDSHFYVLQINLFTLIY